MEIGCRRQNAVQVEKHCAVVVQVGQDRVLSVQRYSREVDKADDSLPQTLRQAPRKRLGWRFTEGRRFHGRAHPGILAP